MSEEAIESETPARPAPGIRKPALNASRAKRLYLIVGVAAVVVLAVYGIWVWVHAGKETTDDAQIAADVVPVAARIGGQILHVAVSENQRVHKGDLIAEIDPSDVRVQLAQAQAELETAVAQAAQADAQVGVVSASAHGGLSAASAGVQSARESVDSAEHSIDEAEAAVAKAEANAERARLDYARARELGEKEDISRAQVDAARAANDAAQADLRQAEARLKSAENAKQLAQSNLVGAQGRRQQSAPVGAQVNAAEAAARLAHAKVDAAKAHLDAARLALSYTRITAPADGIASNLAVHPGASVSPGQPVIQLVPLETYVTANFKETQVEKMKPGQRAVIGVDALGGDEFEGTVESISGGTGAVFSLLPPDNASGNFVKVVQRVPVRIRWEGPDSARVAVGSSVEVTVYTR